MTKHTTKDYLNKPGKKRLNKLLWDDLLQELTCKRGRSCRTEAGDKLQSESQPHLDAPDQTKSHTKITHHRKAAPRHHTRRARTTAHKPSAAPRQPTGRKRKQIYIGNKLPCSLLTEREAHCLLHFAQGKTIRSTAECLNLSPRTVEFYLKNMKNKLNCHSKAEFVQKIISDVSLDDVRAQLDNPIDPQDPPWLII